MGLDFTLRYIINTPRKLAIFAIVFFTLLFLLGFTQTYYCPLIYKDIDSAPNRPELYSGCFMTIAFFIPLFLAVVIALLDDKIRKGKKK